jgi:hypothetical protein
LIDNEFTDAHPLQIQARRAARINRFADQDRRKTEPTVDTGKRRSQFVWGQVFDILLGSGGHHHFR